MCHYKESWRVRTVQTVFVSDCTHIGGSGGGGAVQRMDSDLTRGVIFLLYYRTEKSKQCGHPNGTMTDLSLSLNTKTRDPPQL